MDFYVIDTKTNEIINCISSNSRERAEAVVAAMINPEELRLDPNPPMSMLSKYRYWNERP